MRVSKIEPYQKTKYKIYADDSERPLFVLYRKEVNDLGIKEGSEISEEDYDGILKDILIRRAKARTLYLLDDYSRTEAQLRKKLREGFYPEKAVDEAVEYAKSRHYLDDGYYAREYASERSTRKSRRMIKMELTAKGIDEETVTEAVDSLEISEAEVIEGIIRKKYPDAAGMDFNTRNKMFRSLMNKGFSYDDCRKAYENLT